MKQASRIYIAGHRGLVGSALTRRLRAEGYGSLIMRTHAELDLQDQEEVGNFFARERPEYVLLAAAKVGGIHANSTYPVDFLLTNLKIQNSVIEASWRHGVKGLLFLGSSCIYPKLAPQPLKEEYLLTGPLEPTNEPYAIAKIAGIELCEAFNRQYGTRFLSVMPTNLYGPNDNYDLENSHVLPAFIRKFHLAALAARGNWEAIRKDEQHHGGIPGDFWLSLVAIARSRGHKAPPVSDTALLPAAAIKLWGTGSPRREFLHADDLAEACIFLMQHLDFLFPVRNGSSSADRNSAGAPYLFNIGSGKDLTIRELAEMVREIVGYDGPVEWDDTKPDGTPQKLLDIDRLSQLGWQPKILLQEGIEGAYRDYLLGLGLAL